MSSRPGAGTDALPWYRQFWPWFLIALPGAVVIAAFITLYIATTGADDLVASEYYKDGLAINRRLEKSRMAEELGMSAELKFDAGSVTATLNAPQQPDQLQLRLSHPLEADSDFSLTLARIAPGEYVGHLPRAVGPRWHWSLQEQGGNWRLDGIISPSEDSGEREP
jgi:hypothetical protein